MGPDPAGSPGLSRGVTGVFICKITCCCMEDSGGLSESGETRQGLCDSPGNVGQWFGRQQKWQRR